MAVLVFIGVVAMVAASAMLATLLTSLWVTFSFVSREAA